MPMHDWTAVPPSAYRAFRFMWIAALIDRLNAGGLPPSWFARVEQVMTPAHRNRVTVSQDIETVTSVIESSPAAECGARTDSWLLADHLSAFLRAGVHVLVVDPFPPGRYDPNGIHRASWENVTTSEFEQPADKRLTTVSYQAGSEPTAYVEPFAAGWPIPDMPLVLVEDFYITVPLEETYQTTWNVLLEQIRKLVERSPTLLRSSPCPAASESRSCCSPSVSSSA